MAINSSIGITGSVGSGGGNDPGDVSTVQIRLNELMNPPRKLLVEDGISGPLTRGMIRDFQRGVVGFRWPDGRVDTDGKTIRALNDPASEGIWGRFTPAPKPAPKGGGGGATTPKKPSGGGGGGTSIVDQLVETLAGTVAMTLAEKQILETMAEVLADEFTGANTPAGPGGLLSEAQLAKAKLSLKVMFKIGQVSLHVANGATAGATAAGFATASAAASALGVVMLTVGLVYALLKALGTGQRVYGCVACAYRMTFWVHQTRLPDRSQKVLDMHKAMGMDYMATWDNYVEAWAEGDKRGKSAIEHTVTELERKTGASRSDVIKCMRLILGSRSADTTCRQFLAVMGEAARLSDPQVANSLTHMAVNWEYGK